MFESIYIGMSGLTTFSRALTVIGNNVSNINSAGFKGSQLSFSELVYNNLVADRGDTPGSLQLGNGVGSGGTRVLFKQGEVRQTGNDTDAAINGNGFFVLRQDGQTTYSRSGEFEVDAGGFLVERTTQARVAGLSGGSLQDINILGLRNNPPVPTSVVRFVDTLSTNTASPATRDVSVNVIDSLGGLHALTVHFTRDGTTPTIWTLEVRDAANQLITTGGVRFAGDGSPLAGFSSHTFNFTAPGAASQSITLDFGTPGTTTGATGFSTTDSTLRVASQDGVSPGVLTKVTFDADGTLVASYSNGKTARSQQLALAFFAAPQELTLAGGSAFENLSGQKVTLGNAGDGLFGRIAAQSLEAANVDLAAEFSELIITQRGYQASSQVINTANDMIQQLFDMKSKR